MGDGGAGSSSLYDVAIINDSCIWAVGEIYFLDSTGEPDPAAYQAHWDGKEWNFIKILSRDWGSGTGPYPLSAVTGFAANDIWLSSAADLILWDEKDFSSMAFFMTMIPFNGQVMKMWGTDNSNIFCVGRSGAIYHFLGTKWTNLAGGTTSDFRDVWGIVDPGSRRQRIYAVASSPGETNVVSISHTGGVDTLSWPRSKDLLGIWFKDEFSIYVCGPGVWKHTLVGWKKMPGLTDWYFYQEIRGTGDNDIFTVSWQGVLAHFNGMDWHMYSEIPQDFYLTGLAVSHNIVVAVGYTVSGIWADKACAVIGRRIQ